MSPWRMVLAITYLSCALFSPLSAQQSSVEHPDWGVNLTIGGTGLAIGNIPRVNGIRINFRDYHLDEVNGLNLTLWPPQKNHRAGGIVRGLAFGLTAPTADRIQGISLGGLAVVAGGGSLTGINVGGLAVVAAEGVARGINLGGLAVVGVEGVEGLSIGGLAVASEEYVRGLSLGGYKVDAPVGSGMAGAVWKVEVDDFKGLSVAAWNEHDSRARGLSIGLFNRTEELHGIQIGLLNYAGNNLRFRWLPVINAHF